jgi:hypothetical protein
MKSRRVPPQLSLNASIEGQRPRAGWLKVSVCVSVLFLLLLFCPGPLNAVELLFVGDFCPVLRARSASCFLVRRQRDFGLGQNLRDLDF